MPALTRQPFIKSWHPPLLAWVISLLIPMHLGLADDELNNQLNDLKLPGISINAKKGFIDVDARVALTSGTLEFIACTKNTKEHESIIAVEAKPIHIHTALLLLGAEPGHPAMHRKVGEGDETYWIHLPPKGDKIHVSLVVKDIEGKPTEHPISAFIEETEDEYDQYLDDSKSDDQEKPKPFPTNNFIFAGSHLHGEDDDQPKRYLADISGHVISISTFGDEVLCLEGIHGHADGRLLWQVNDTHLPALDAKITLRLKPIKNAVKKE